MKIIYDHNIIPGGKINFDLKKINQNLFTELSIFEKTLKLFKNSKKVNPKKEKNLDNWPKQDGVFFTFDDGYLSFINYVLPLLEKYKMPAILFITTDFVNDKSTPFEIELLNIISKQCKITTCEGREEIIETPGEKKKLYQEIKRYLKIKNNRFRQDYLKRLKAKNNIKTDLPSNLKHLSWSEIKKIDNHPLITIGAHSKTHPELKKITAWEQHREIKGSKKKLEKKLGHKIEFFSYPYGSNSRKTRLITKVAGFKLAFTTKNQGVLNFQNIDKFNVPRIEVKKIYETKS